MKPAQLKIGRGKRQPRLVPKTRINGGDKIPADIRSPNFGEVRGSSFVKPGLYVCRNGSIANVEEAVTLKFGVQMRQSWQGWRGQLVGHTGEKLVWGLDGKRSDATPQHEHDLIRRHKNQKGKK